MPNKKPKYNGSDDQYISEYVSYLKGNNPDISDDVATKIATSGLNRERSAANADKLADYFSKSTGLPLNQFLPTPTQTNEYQAKLNEPNPIVKKETTIQTSKKPSIIDSFRQKYDTNTPKGAAIKAATDQSMEQIMNPQRSSLKADGIPIFDQYDANKLKQQNFNRNINGEVAGPIAPKVPFPKQEVITPIEQEAPTPKRVIKPSTYGFVGDDILDDNEYQARADAELGANSPVAARQAFIDKAKEIDVNTINEQINKQAKAIPDADFKKIIGFDEIVKPYSMKSVKEGIGDMVTTMFLDESKADTREYINSPEFKFDLLYMSGGDPSKMKEVAAQLAKNRHDEAFNNTSAYHRKTNELADWLNERKSPVGKFLGSGAYIAGNLGAGYSASVGDVIAGGSAALETLYDKVVGNETDFFKNNAKYLDYAKTFVPEFHSDKAKGVTKIGGDIANTIGYIKGMVSAPSAPKVVEGGLNKALGIVKNSPLSRAEQLLAKAAGKSASEGNKFLASTIKRLQGEGVLNTAKVLDHTIQNYVTFGAPVLNDEYERYQSLGFTPKKAKDMAMGSTFVNMLGLAAPNGIRAAERGLADKIINAGWRGSTRAALKQGLNFGTDMLGVKMAKTALDRANGINVGDSPFGEQIDQSAKGFVTDGVIGVALNFSSKGRGYGSRMQHDAISQALESPDNFQQSLAEVQPEVAERTTQFLNTIKPSYDMAIRGGLKGGEAAQWAIEKTKGEQAERKLRNMQPETYEYTTIDKKTGKEEKVTQYLHDDGVWYDYQDPKKAEQKRELVDIARNARKDATNILRGTFTGNRILTSNQIKTIVAKDSPEGKMKKGQSEKIEDNAPYRADIINLTDYANNPEVKVAMEQLSGASDKSFEANQPVIDADGNVIDGAKTIAHAILNGGTTIKAFKPIEKSEINDAIQESIDTSIGETDSKVEQLDKVATKALSEMKNVYEEHIDNNFLEDGRPDFAGGVKSVIRDAIERGYGKEDTINMTMRVTDKVSEPILEGVYNDAIKEQSNEQPTTNKSEGVSGSALKEKSDVDIEKRMAEIEGAKIGSPELAEFNALEKEMEKRERATVFNTPLEKVNEAVDALMQKEKDKPNGFGSFIDNKDAVETKEIAKKYLNPKSISESELKQDFKDAVMGNPETWYADGLKLRESMKELAERGIKIEDAISKIENEFIIDGYTKEDAEKVLAKQQKVVNDLSREIIELNEKADKVAEVNPNQLEIAIAEPITETKKVFDELLETHKEKLKVKSETKKKAVAEKEAEIVAEKPNIKILSENFKTTLKMLKEKGIIEVRDMEDC